MTDLAGVRLVPLNTHTDPRGKLTVVEGASDIPFEIRRIFYVYAVTENNERGAHAHPNTEQFLIAIGGKVTIDVCTPTATQTYPLDDPSVGLYVPPMLWVRLYDFSPDGVCLAAASTHYGEEIVIREWDEYVQFLNEMGEPE